MSKRAAIDTAVCLQLYSEGKVPQYRVAMTDTTLGGTAYTRATMQSFLIGVANRLKLDVPSLSFAWKNVNLDDCLTATLLSLEDLIEAEST
jgi:hypothetical protein